MRILLTRPACANERFGLAPFFRIEPLGLEYIASALLERGHEVMVADLRFGKSLPALLRSFRPQVVGVANIHTLDTPGTLATVRAVKRHGPGIFTLVGGHAAASYPCSLFDLDVDAICVGDGEVVAPALIGALEKKLPVEDVPGLWVRSRGAGRGPAGTFVMTPSLEQQADLDAVPLPARNLVAGIQSRYHLVHKNPMHAVETARGCPFQCTFCSVWRLSGKTYRTRSIDAVCRDISSTGENIFIIDDLFWHPHGRSFDLGKELKRLGIRKGFTLVQTRLDLVTRIPDVLEVWRPFSHDFDIFFGFEAPTDHQLTQLGKGFDVSTVEEAVRVARYYGYGVTGNFVIDPDWEESDFQAMWDFVDRLELSRVGYTVLTPLPGTSLFDQMAERIVERDWSKYDMHHLLFEPRLGRRRFFELFTQSWKRNVLSAGHSTRNWLAWLREVKISQIALLCRILYQTQRNCNVDAYMKECFPLQAPAALASCPACERVQSRSSNGAGRGATHPAERPQRESNGQ